MDLVKYTKYMKRVEVVVAKNLKAMVKLSIASKGEGVILVEGARIHVSQGASLHIRGRETVIGGGKSPKAM